MQNIETVQELGAFGGRGARGAKGHNALFFLLLLFVVYFQFERKSCGLCKSSRQMLDISCRKSLKYGMGMLVVVSS